MRPRVGRGEDMSGQSLTRSSGREGRRDKESQGEENKVKKYIYNINGKEADIQNKEKRKTHIILDSIKMRDLHRFT